MLHAIVRRRLVKRVFYKSFIPVCGFVLLVVPVIALNRERLLLDLGFLFGFRFLLDLGFLLDLRLLLDLGRNRTLALDPLRTRRSRARRFARRTVVLPLAMRAGGALRAVGFPLAVRAGVARRAAVFHPAVRATVALCALAFQLAVRARVALCALVFLLAVRAPLPCPFHDSRSVIACRAPRRVLV